MDFSISEEQAMLADSIARFIDNDYDFEERQKIVASELGYSPTHWQQFAELGITAVPFSEEDGGLDGGPVELMLIMEQMGRGLVVEPFLANIVLAGGILRRTGTTEQKERWLTPLIEGSAQSALAFAEPHARFDCFDIKSTASENESGFVLNGSKTFVLNGDRANSIIIPARISGGSNKDGISLFLIPGDTTGLEISAYPTVDGQQAAELQMTNVDVTRDNLLGAPGSGSAILREVIDEATLAVCAEAVGIMRTMHDKTVEYTKSRTQFGVPISSFQALQHRMVETLMLCEQSKSLLLWAVMKESAVDDDSRKAISALKHQIGTAGIQVAREAVQLHGGMGVSWELDIAHYFKRLAAIDVLFGNADFHLDRYVDLVG